MRYFAAALCPFLWLTSVWAVVVPTATETTAADRASVHITVYNNNLALVREIRQVRLESGVGELRFMDVAEKILAESVRIQSLSNPSLLGVLEQNYEFDLLNPNKLLEKYVGKEITLIQKKLENNTERMENFKAELLSANEGQVWRINGQIVVNPSYTSLVFPNLPENLIAHPTLIWLLENRGPSSQQLELSYLTDGLGWKSDYVMVLDESERTAGLTGWVTLNNECGASFSNARLKLIAGDVRRVQPRPAPKVADYSMVAARAEAGFIEKAFFEYHLYDLQRPATLKNSQSKQITLLEAAGVQMQKELKIVGEAFLYQGGTRGVQKQDVQVHMRFRNSEQNKLGIPLPAGTMRVYKRDTDGSQVFVGEDAIDHTPKNEEVTVSLGNAFDVVAERKQMDFRRLAPDLLEIGMQVVLRNHKETDVMVTVEERLPGDWKIITSSHESEKADAGTLRFRITIPKNGESKLEYRAQIRS